MYRAEIFRARTPPEAIGLVSRLLEYTPSSRITPLQACAHTFFDELRAPNTRLPNGCSLPPLFNFTEHVLTLSSSAAKYAYGFYRVVCGDLQLKRVGFQAYYRKEPKNVKDEALQQMQDVKGHSHKASGNLTIPL
ncbi:hypothetical protein J437_LFUL010550 [Ladona fulva]|uniref:Glycogen synthase kinase-3 beta n=1 Tax=Ladona fulva TaxID=123851 RepID=A0A8K0KDW0_LADFU|nr:hypothetical protein J437_LFUL010550 [Ladona fulva]